MSGLFTNDRQNDYLNPAGKTGGATQAPQIVAVYDTNQQAHVARDGLIAAGIARASIHAIDRADASATRSIESRRQAFWAAVGSLFAPAATILRCTFGSESCYPPQPSGIPHPDAAPRGLLP